MQWERTVILMLALMLFGALASAARAEPTAETEHAKLQLLVDANQGWAAIHYELAEHWHIYWKNPGDSGLETQLTWELPEGITAGEIHWPSPKRIEYSGLFNYGYEDSVALLVPLTFADSVDLSQSEISVHVEFLICKDICIPEEATLSMNLANADKGNMSGIVEFYRTKLPKTYNGAASYSVDTDSAHFTFDLIDEPYTPSQIYRAWWYPLDSPALSNASDQRWKLDDSSLKIDVAREGKQTPNPFHGYLEIDTTDGQKHVYEIGATLEEGATSPAEESSADPKSETAATPAADMTLLLAIISAFLGGIILNVMPCVLPVLSLKALSIAKKADAERGAIRLQGLAYTVGILASFIVVAGALIALQHAGASIGWGFQLQSIGFVSILIYVLFLVGLNLSGMFEVPARATGFGSTLAAKDGPSGSFFTGVLATIVATPCTAPFMATAIGFALSQPAYVAIIVFIALGLGLAFPFLLITFIPGFTKLLPKPGNWMERFRQFLAFPIYATVIWLLWVLAQQAGPMGLAGTMVGMLIISFALWLLPQCRSRLSQIIILIVAVVGLFAVTETQNAPPSMEESDVTHEMFSKAKLDDLLAQNKPVFVNATAAWCITCKVNERVALRDESVLSAMKEKGITFLTADWTNRNDEITRYLASFDRSGVPIYVYYAPDKEPVILPQLLTPSIVLDAFESH